MGQFVIEVRTPFGSKEFTVDYTGYDPGDDYVAGLIYQQYEAAWAHLQAEGAQFSRVPPDQRPDPIDV